MKALAPMKDQLLTIKLYTPPLRPDLVQRSRLLQKLNAGLQRGSQLSLICAPAGYGKTTVVLEWLKALDRPNSWLSLDRGDNHPVLFLAYLIAALQQVDPNTGREELAALGAFDSSSASRTWLQEQMAALINQIAAARTPFVLVLDDYHLINDLAIHEALSFLLEHQPPAMHLVITTRQDPLLPLPKLRSQGRLTEVRLGDLRFTTEEASTFLNETMALALSPEQVASLESRTEGWIAGLQLAALSLARPAAEEEAPAQTGLHRAEEDSAWAAAFSGDDRHVVDYLMDEVLSRQPERMQRFLLQTSILKRLCAPLCDAVLNKDVPQGEADRLSPEPVSPSQKVLEELEQKNVFIIPLDNRRHWYRYHHLFGDLLHSRLQSSDPARLHILHQRASQWFEREGSITEAVDHALLAENFDRALRLIDQAARTKIWSSGDLPTLLNWSNRLPEEALLSRPRLCLYYARGLFFRGQVAVAERYLETAAKALQERDAAGETAESEAAAQELWGVTFTNRATFAAMRGDTESALQLVRRGQELLPARDDPGRARLAHALGMAHYFEGNCGRSAEAFMESISLAEKAGNQILGLDAISCLALSRLMAGELREAERVCVEGLVAWTGSEQAPAASAVYLALAEVYYEQNALQRAQRTVEICIELGRKAGWAHVLWQAYTLQARIMQAVDDDEGSRQALLNAESVAERYPLLHVRRMVDACRAELNLANGHGVQAPRWAEALQQRASDDLPEIIVERERLTQARILLARDEPSGAVAALESLLPPAEAAGRGRTVVEARALQALGLKVMGEEKSAGAALQRALTVAGPEAFTRPFLQMRSIPQGGENMADLLGQVRGERVQAPLMRLAWELLSALGEEGVTGQQTLSETPELVEPLSEREREVLALIANGLSNPEVADRLFLSPNTVRVHTSNIYAKLDVHNRVSAVAKAQALGLLADE